MSEIRGAGLNSFHGFVQWYSNKNRDVSAFLDKTELNAEDFKLYDADNDGWVTMDEIIKAEGESFRQSLGIAQWKTEIVSTASGEDWVYSQVTLSKEQAINGVSYKAGTEVTLLFGGLIVDIALPEDQVNESDSTIIIGNPTFPEIDTNKTDTTKVAK